MTVQIAVLPVTGLNGIDLRCGSHHSRDAGVCAMEAVAWLAGERHTDHPQCSCTVISGFMRRWNDRLPNDEERNRLLKPLLPLLIGTRSTTAVEKLRVEMIRDWVARDATPALLSLAGLNAAADLLRSDPTPENIREAGRQASAARAAARAAARKKLFDAVDEVDAVDAVAAVAAVAAVDAVAAVAAFAAFAAVAAFAAFDAVDAVAAVAAVDWKKLSYAEARTKAREILTPIVLAKFEPLREALELGAQDLVRKMAALNECAAPEFANGEGPVLT